MPDKKSHNTDETVTQPVKSFTFFARPLVVDPVLLACDPDEQVMFQSNIGLYTSSGCARAGDYVSEIQATIKRQAEGYFTVAEAAQVLQDSEPGVDAKMMIKQMLHAFHTGKFVIRNPGDKLPVLNKHEVRDFLHLVKVSDINDWLTLLDVGYLFPRTDSAPVKNMTVWNLKRPARFQGYSKPLHDLLKAASNAGAPCPRARDVLDAWKVRRPPEVLEVTNEELKYQDAKGGVKVADLDAIRQTIKRMID